MPADAGNFEKRIQDHIRKCGIVRRRQSLKRKEQNESKRKEELKIKNSVNQS